MTSQSSVLDLPELFEPEVEEVAVGTHFYRVYSVERGPVDFNPGVGGSTRFAFFGSPPEPVLYAGASGQVAVAETLLHDLPVTGGLPPYERYAGAVMSRIETFRPLRLAVLHGLSLRRQVASDALTSSPAHTYSVTVQWSEAAFAAGFDGLVWMSSKCNDAKAYVFFGSRCRDAFAQDSTFGRSPRERTRCGSSTCVPRCTSTHCCRSSSLLRVRC